VRVSWEENPEQAGKLQENASRRGAGAGRRRKQPGPVTSAF
jgi:hypothetical protein